MKRAYLISLFLVFTFTLSAQKGGNRIDDNYLKKNNTKGKVKKVSEYRCSKPNESKTNRRLLSSHIFSMSGDILEQEFFNDSGGNTRKEIYNYDTKGNFVSRYTYWFYVDFKMCFKDSVLSYDNRGNVTAYVAYEGDSITNKITMEFDNLGNIIEHVNYELPKDTIRYKYTYLNKGKTILCQSFRMKHTSLYDNKSRLIEYSVFDLSAKEITSHYKYLYDKKGNLIEEKNLMNLKNIERWQYSNYDKNGKLVKTGIH